MGKPDGDHLRGRLRSTMTDETFDKLVAAGQVRQGETANGKQGLAITPEGYDALVALLGIGWATATQMQETSPELTLDFQNTLFFVLGMGELLDEIFPLYDLLDGKSDPVEALRRLMEDRK